MRGEDPDMFLGFGGSDSDYNKFFRYHQKKEKFPVPIINLLNSKILATKISSGTGSETFFRYQFFPILVPRLFSGTNFSDTGSGQTVVGKILNINLLQSVEQMWKEEM